MDVLRPIKKHFDSNGIMNLEDLSKKFQETYGNGFIDPVKEFSDVEKDVENITYDVKKDIKEFKCDVKKDL